MGIKSPFVYKEDGDDIVRYRNGEEHGRIPKSKAAALISSLDEDLWAFRKRYFELEREAKRLLVALKEIARIID